MSEKKITIIIRTDCDFSLNIDNLSYEEAIAVLFKAHDMIKEYLDTKKGTYEPEREWVPLPQPTRDSSEINFSDFESIDRDPLYPKP